MRIFNVDLKKVEDNYYQNHCDIIPNDIYYEIHITGDAYNKLVNYTNCKYSPLEKRHENELPSNRKDETTLLVGENILGLERNIPKSISDVCRKIIIKTFIYLEEKSSSELLKDYKKIHTSLVNSYKKGYFLNKETEGKIFDDALMDEKKLSKRKTNTDSSINEDCRSQNSRGVPRYQIMEYLNNPDYILFIQMFSINQMLTVTYERYKPMEKEYIATKKKLERVKFKADSKTWLMLEWLSEAIPGPRQDTFKNLIYYFIDSDISIQKEILDIPIPTL